MVHTMPSNSPMIAAIAKALRNRRRKAGLGGFLAFPLIAGSHIAAVLVEPLRHCSSSPLLTADLARPTDLLHRLRRWHPSDLESGAFRAQTWR